jgi:large subunit ribosomal protein L6
MSRIGKIPVKIPDKVKVSVSGAVVKVEGPKGKLDVPLAKGVTLDIKKDVVNVVRPDESTSAKSLHGLSRTLIANAVLGVTTGWQRQLEINGVGFKAEMKGKKVQFTLGFSHPILFDVPEGIAIELQKEGKVILVKGADKELVGSTASKVRSLRRPDPYKAYGVKYTEETIRRKEGKTGAA